MCLFSDISCRVSEIIPADRSSGGTDWYRPSDQVKSTPSIIGQPRARLSSVESTLLSIVLVAISTQHEDDQATSTSSIIGQPRARLSSVESTLLSIVLVAISTQHEDDQASQRRLTTVTVFKSQPSTSQTDCVESKLTLHSVVSVVTSQHLNESSLRGRHVPYVTD